MIGRAFMLTTILAILAAAPLSAQPMRHDYPSCELEQQHRLRVPTGGTNRDPRQAHISMRANILQADIGNARTARRLNRREAQTLWNEVARVHRDANRFVTTQGFLSVGETASYDRALDMVATRLCRRN